MCVHNKTDGECVHLNELLEVLRACAPTGNKENMELTELLHQTGAGGEVNAALTVRAAVGNSSGAASTHQGDCNRQTLSSAPP